MFSNAVVFGASGAIGLNFVKQIKERYPDTIVHACSRAEPSELPDGVKFIAVDYRDEDQLQAAATKVKEVCPPDLIIIATGILHDQEVKPEKSLRDINESAMAHVYFINTIVPALIAKHFLPILCKNKKAVLAALSARVGSISDNHLGGWYSYRCSKSALNMFIKNAAIEVGRFKKNTIVLGLHPGTVDSALSKPYQAHVKPDHLFQPEFSVSKMIEVLEGVSENDTGKCIDYNNNEVMP